MLHRALSAHFLSRTVDKTSEKKVCKMSSAMRTEYNLFLFEATSEVRGQLGVAAPGGQCEQVRPCWRSEGQSETGLDPPPNYLSIHLSISILIL